MSSWTNPFHGRGLPQMSADPARPAPSEVRTLTCGLEARSHVDKDPVGFTKKRGLGTIPYASAGEERPGSSVGESSSYGNVQNHPTVSRARLRPLCPLSPCHRPFALPSLRRNRLSPPGVGWPVTTHMDWMSIWGSHLGFPLLLTYTFCFSKPSAPPPPPEVPDGDTS